MSGSFDVVKVWSNGKIHKLLNGLPGAVGKGNLIKGDHTGDIAVFVKGSGRTELMVLYGVGDGGIGQVEVIEVEPERGVLETKKTILEYGFYKKSGQHGSGVWMITSSNEYFLDPLEQDGQQAKGTVIEKVFASAQSGRYLFLLSRKKKTLPSQST